MRSATSVEYQYNILVDILAEMVTSYITKQSNPQIGEIKSENKNDK